MKQVFVVTRGAPGPGAEQLVREVLPEDGSTPIQEVLPAIVKALDGACEFVEVEDAEGRGVASVIEWQRYPGHEGLWRLGPFWVEPGNRPVAMTQAEVEHHLRTMLEGVISGDTMEGSFSFSVPTSLDPDPDVDYMAMGAYRVGNLQGQGGVVLVGERP